MLRVCLELSWDAEGSAVQYMQGNAAPCATIASIGRGCLSAHYPPPYYCLFAVNCKAGLSPLTFAGQKMLAELLLPVVVFFRFVLVFLFCMLTF